MTLKKKMVRALFVASFAFVSIEKMWSAESSSSSSSQEEGQASDVQRVEQEIREMTNRQEGDLPPEQLLAVLVKLNPKDLLSASQVSHDWYDVAILVMRDNLRKRGWEGSYATPQEIVAEYKKMLHYDICPQFGSPDEVSSFLTVLGASVSRGTKAYFDFENKQWGIDNQLIEPYTTQASLHPSIQRAMGDTRYIGGNTNLRYFFIDRIRLDRHEIVEADARGPRRIRCHYKGIQVGDNRGKDAASIPFTITAMIQ